MHSRNHRSPTAFGKIRAAGKTFFGGQEKRNEKVRLKDGYGGVVVHCHLDRSQTLWTTMNLSTNFLVAGRGYEEEQCERDGSILYAAANIMCSHYSLSTPS